MRAALMPSSTSPARSWERTDLRPIARKSCSVLLTELGIQKIACPLFEVRIQKNPPAVEVFDEQMIPSMFWRTPDPVLDKALLKEHMKAGEEIPGARLIQGESLRVK